MSDERNCLFNDDFKNIINRYNYTVINNNYVCANKVNYMFFENTIKKIEIELQNKKEILNKKLENINDNKALSNKLILDEIMEDYQKIKVEAKKDVDSDNSILQKILEDYINNLEKNGAFEIYKNISKNIVDNTVKKLIRYEKKLILLMDKLKIINL